MALNLAMNAANSALVPDPSKTDPLTSRPYTWPFNLAGLRMTTWDGSVPRLFLVGLVPTWAGGTVVLALALLMMAVHAVARARSLGGASSWSADGDDWRSFCFWCWLLILGWALHYAPFWLMGRVTYLHHYVPATLFTAVLTGKVTHVLAARGGGVAAHPATWAGAVVLAVFWVFRSVPYGLDGPLEQFAHLQWVASWKIVD